MFQTPSGFNTDDFFPRARLTRAKRCGDRGPSNIRPDLQDIPRADSSKVIDEEQNVRVQHGSGASDFFQPMAHARAAVLH